VSAPCPVFGFEVVLHLAPGVSESAARTLWREFVADVIEPRGLLCEGGTAAGRWSHVVHGEAGQATDADREAVAAWAESRREIASVDVGPLVDLHGVV
jgi:uncharacterized protein YggL (DUF469 family)